MHLRKLGISILGAVFYIFSHMSFADETCMSPYMAKIVGQEDYVYVWTLGVEGLGDEQDKLVTIDVNPKSKTYSKKQCRGSACETLSMFQIFSKARQSRPNLRKAPFKKKCRGPARDTEKNYTRIRRSRSFSNCFRNIFRMCFY